MNRGSAPEPAGGSAPRPAFWVGTGWKMNHDNAQARDAARVLRGVTNWHNVQPFVLPPFTALEAVAGELADTPVLVGAQNMHWDDHGAWTGEISALMLRSCGARLVELGHSERRTHFNETDETINQKVHAALRHDLIPLICVGETGDERERGLTADVLSRQVSIALHNVETARVLIAYEPVWSIGVAGRAADPQTVTEALTIIRAALAPKVTIPILYGGSVTQANALDYATIPGINGLFIGRAAWQPDGLIQIVERIAKTIRDSPAP